MIIIKLTGGLGNQLFQYALGRRLSIDRDSPLKLDITSFNDGIRAYKLNKLRIIAEIANREEISKFIYPYRRGFLNDLNDLYQTKIPYEKKRIVKEQSLLYDSRILNGKRDVYLSGYWQSYKYFNAIFDKIRQEFSVINDPDEQNQELIQKILSEESVAIHFRRGDYVTNPNIRTCTPDYYAQAIELINKRSERPHYFIFSDDPDWVKNNFNFTGKRTYINHNGSEKDYEDLRLMSFCKHHIIANSTFSWWGAWLSDYKDKIIISPKNWFYDRPNNLDDLIPQNWIQL